MKSILIREVPIELHLQLKHRAKSRGQSLQQYLLQELATLATRPTMNEVLERIQNRSLDTVDMGKVVRDLEEQRRRST
jgi:hypothetical protein